MKEEHQQLYRAIVNFKRTHDYNPTYKELAEMCGIQNRQTVHGRLKTMRKLGYVTWNDRDYRTIRPL